MAENISLNNVATFQNDTSAVNTVNNNNTAIVNAFTDVLSRSGVSPNQMGSTLDMNGNQIINLPFPTTLNSPARLADVTSAQNITIINATTGTSGHTVPFLDGTNTWSAPQSIVLGSLGINTGFNISEVSSGTNASGVFINSINITDTINASPQFSNGLVVTQSFGTSSATGGRQAVSGVVNLTSATNAASANRQYIGVSGVAQANSADTGTSPSAFGTSAGQIFGSSSVAVATVGATSLQAVGGASINTQMATGSSTWSKSLLAISSNPSDVVNGSGINTMLWLFNQSGASAKWTNALLIDNEAGTGVFPISTTGTLIKTSGGATVANGIDFSSTAFSGTSFSSPAFSVNGSGIITSGSSGLASGNLILNGITSGFVSVFSSSTGNLLTVSQPIQVGQIGSVAGQVNIAGLTSGSAQLSCSATGGQLQMGAGNVIVFPSGSITCAGQIAIDTGVAPPAAGSTSVGYLFTTTPNLGVFVGAGAPTFSAAQGSIYLNTTGNSTSTRLYVNTTGSNVWTNFTSAA